MSEDKNSMRVPEGYFDNKKKDFLQFATGDEDMLDLSKDAPILNGLNKKEGFLLPPNYFETLEISTDDKKVVQLESKARRKSLVYYAAAACFAFIFGYFTLSGVMDTETLPSSGVASSTERLQLESDLEIEEAYAFLLDELDDFSVEELIYEQAYSDFLLEEDGMTDNELETIIDDLSDEFQIEDFETLF